MHALRARLRSRHGQSGLPDSGGSSLATPISAQIVRWNGLRRFAAWIS